MKRNTLKKKITPGVNILKLNKQTVKDLNPKATSPIKGGAPYVSGQQCDVSQCCSGAAGSCWKTGKC